MTTQIVVSNPVTTAVTPKPTKTEIIEALVRLKMQEKIAEKEVADKESERLAEELEQAFKQLILKHPAKYVATAYFGWKRNEEVNDCTISFRVGDEMPKSIKDKVIKYRKLASVCVPQEKTLRNMIRQQVNMNGTIDQRVQALIDSPQANKALKQMLKSLGV